jgi:hypothetical protein
MKQPMFWLLITLLIVFAVSMVMDKAIDPGVVVKTSE